MLNRHIRLSLNKPTPKMSSEEDSEGAGIILDPKLVERGLGRYEALECGNCHGANGEGTDLRPACLTST